MSCNRVDRSIGGRVSTGSAPSVLGVDEGDTERGGAGQLES